MDGQRPHARRPGSVCGRIGYSLATGLAIALACFRGLPALLLALIPLVAILPVLLYIGLVIGARLSGLPGPACPPGGAGLAPQHPEWAKTQVDGAGKKSE